MAKMAEDDPRGMMPCKLCGKPSRLPIHPECLTDYDAGKARTSPAFPMPYTRENSGPAGLTKREYMATKMLAAFIANPAYFFEDAEEEDNAISAAIDYTDKLLAALLAPPATHRQPPSTEPS